MIRCALITIGDELLFGNIDDTNATWLSQTLTNYGVKVGLRFTVGDSTSDIHLALNAALDASDIVILTGGLGPTQDDKTREAISSFCNRKLVQNEPLCTCLKIILPAGALILLS